MMFLSLQRRTPSGRTAATVVAGALVGLALLSGCSDSSKSPNVSGLKMVPSSKAHDMLVKAKETVAAKGTAHIAGLIVADGSPMTVDMKVATAAGAGTVEVGGFVAEVRVVNGALYLKGGPDFWDVLHKGVGAGFGDTWVKVSARTGAQFGALLDLVPATSALDKLAPSNSSWTEVPGRKLDGADSVGVQDVQSGHGNTVYIAKANTPTPLGIELAKGGLLTFTDWGKAVANVKAPGGDVLDASDAKLSDAVLPTN